MWAITAGKNILPNLFKFCKRLLGCSPLSHRQAGFGWLDLVWLPSVPLKDSLAVPRSFVPNPGHSALILGASATWPLHAALAGAVETCGRAVLLWAFSPPRRSHCQGRPLLAANASSRRVGVELGRAVSLAIRGTVASESTATFGHHHGQCPVLPATVIGLPKLSDSIQPILLKNSP